MTKGDKYWTYFVNENRWHQVMHSVYNADLTDNKRKRDNRIFDTNEEALEALEMREGIK